MQLSKISQTKAHQVVALISHNIIRFVRPLSKSKDSLSHETDLRRELIRNLSAAPLSSFSTFLIPLVFCSDGVGQKIIEEALIMEKRKCETLKTDKMRLEHTLTQAKKRLDRMCEEVDHLRGRLKLHKQIDGNPYLYMEGGGFQYQTFYIHDLEAKLDAYRYKSVA